ncbi:hypothetical protein CRUP_033474 [Coryphaenoides rupestris]|nr:hypothetical protein CRUP_033474 [Coryphaenoides rupestris]
MILTQGNRYQYSRHEERALIEQKPQHCACSKHRSLAGGILDPMLSVFLPKDMAMEQDCSSEKRNYCFSGFRKSIDPSKTAIDGFASNSPNTHTQWLIVSY